MLSLCLTTAWKIVFSFGSSNDEVCERKKRLLVQIHHLVKARNMWSTIIQEPLDREPSKATFEGSE